MINSTMETEMAYYTLNATGLSELREIIANYSRIQYEPTPADISRLEERATCHGPDNVHYELGRDFDKSGNPQIYGLSAAGFDRHEDEE